MKSLVTRIGSALLAGLLLTAYLEPLEMMLLTPLRNLVYFGQLSDQTFDGNIPKLHYRDGTIAANPVSIAQVAREEALAVLRGGKLGDSSPRTLKRHDLILEIADFFVDSAELTSIDGRELARWAYTFRASSYDMNAPWYSGMAQGHAIEVLLAAYIIAGEQRYLELARKGGNLFLVEVDQGGVAVPVPGGIWYEEYAKAAHTPPRVLNGHVFALEALYELKQLDPHFGQAFAVGVAALRENLGIYDKIIWSTYDTTGIPANYSYQRLHVRQLRQMYEWTQNELFRSYARKFQAQLFLPFGPAYRIMAYPSRFLGALILLNTLVVFGFAWFYRRQRQKFS